MYREKWKHLPRNYLQTKEYGDIFCFCVERTIWRRQHSIMWKIGFLGCWNSLVKSRKGEEEINLHLAFWPRYNLVKFRDPWLRWHGPNLWVIFKYVPLKIWAQGKKMKTGKFYPFAIIKQSECFFCFVFFPQLFHHKTWWRPDAISRLTRTLHFYKKKALKVLEKYLPLSLSKEICSLSTWCNNLKI